MVKIIENVKTRTVPCNHCHALLSYEGSDIQKKKKSTGRMYVSDIPVGTIMTDYITCPQCKTSIYI